MPQADPKNINYKNGQAAKVGDMVQVVELDQHQRPATRRAILVAMNAEIAKNNGRYVLETNLHALPTCSINSVELVEASEQKEVAFKFTTKAQGLRLDGPTLEEFVKAGYAPSLYPPKGYAEVLSPEEQFEADAAVEKFRREKYNTVTAPAAPQNPVAAPTAQP